ncbi:MAG: hypothetical protein ACYTHJ_07350 [Planctomycetota bacterium]
MSGKSLNRWTMSSPLALFPCTQVFGAAYVTAVHGIPGQDLDMDPALPVDVSVDGACAVPGFTFREIVGGIELKADPHDVAISFASDTPCSNDPILSVEGAVLEDGGNYSIVAYLTEGDDPIISAFENDLRTPRAFARVDEAVFGPATLDLERGTAYLVYAVVSLADETFTVLISTA